MAEYLLDNTAAETAARFDALAWTYDEASRQSLAATGLGPGRRCWEVGGGGGAIAAWLSDQVGAAGSVLVTDIEPRWMHDVADRENVTLCRHDVVRDALPDKGFDLIHARLVLLHLPERHLVLDRLISCLRPGGCLVIEDFDCEGTLLQAAPSRAAAEVFEVVHGAFLQLLRSRGADPGWGRLLPAALRDHGLSEVSTRTHATTWPGGGSGIALHRANIDQVGGELREYGVDEEMVAEFRALLDDPAFVAESYPLITATGWCFECPSP